MNESPFLRMLKNKIIPLDSSYLHELEVLRVMLRQEDYQGGSGWGGSWTQERYQNLKEKHPDALIVFQTELRLEKERERRREETFERLMPSAYVERQTVRENGANPNPVMEALSLLPNPAGSTLRWEFQ